VRCGWLGYTRYISNLNTLNVGSHTNEMQCTVFWLRAVVVRYTAHPDCFSTVCRTVVLMKARLWLLQLTNFLNQDSFLRNWYSAGKEISRHPWNPKVHYCVHNSPPLDRILSHTNTVSTPSHPIFWRSSLILSSHLCLFFRRCTLYKEWIRRYISMFQPLTIITNNNEKERAAQSV